MKTRTKRVMAYIGIIIGSALGLGTAMAVVPAVTPTVSVEKAEAHTGDLAVKATCLADSGLYELTFTLTMANVPSGLTAKVESHTDDDFSFNNGWNYSTFSGGWTTRATNVPSTQHTVSWTTTIPGTTTGNGPWEYAFTTWSDNYTVKSDTRAEDLKGNCVKKVDPKVVLDGTATCQVDGTYKVDWAVTLSDYGNLSEVDLKVIKHLPAGSLINGVDAQVWLNEWVEHHANHGLPPWPSGDVATFTQTGIPGSATSATAGVQYDFKGGPSGDPEKTITLGGDCTKAKDADASVTTKTDETCTAASTVEFNLVNATWDGPADLTVGTHTRSATANTNHLFSDGSVHKTVTYTINAPDPTLCPKDATASVVVDQQETCLAGSMVKAELQYATLDGPLDMSVGTHSIGATADANHFFGDASSHVTLTYEVKAADPSLCPKDASASASVDQQQTCLTDSTVAFTLAHASWETAAETSVGDHERWAVADTGFLFPDGSQRFKVTYTITAADPSLCPQDASASVSADQKENCQSNSTVKFNLVNATWDGPADTTVGTHTRTATATTGHLFANGTIHASVTYTIKAYTTCGGLAMTGSSPMGLLILAGVLLLAGLIFVATMFAWMRRSRQS